jgi:glutamate formiminotransferase
MPGRIVECVPNFSEGRDPRIVHELCRTIASVAGALVLDSTSDPDHHRSVITFAGDPEAVLEAAVRAVGMASELIDLNTHSGVHPRIGATDVVPFVPVTGVTMEACVSLSRRCAQEVWQRFQVPSYFYEESASDPSRARLENLRRTDFRGEPDTGSGRHPRAGVSVIGARRFLIAWNVNLRTMDLTAARTIAKAIRESSGGLPAVKALGLELQSMGQTQVSMNLTDFERTPLHVVFAAIQHEAQRLGAEIAGSELIGLLPERALELSAGHDLRWLNFTPDSVLESRLARLRREAAQGGPR